MSKVPFQYVNGVIILIAGGKSYTVPANHPNHKAIVKLLNKDNAGPEIVKLLDVVASVNRATGGKVTVKDGVVYYGNQPVHNAVAKKILHHISDGVPFDGLARFLEKVDQNQSFHSRQELFDFLEHRKLPITEDGDFLAYKAVRSDWADKHTGKISNKIGQVVSMKRGSVDDDRRNECSYGLHCGALDYVYSFANGDDRIVIVKVNPADAVSVPADHSYQKLRVCRYEVIGEFQGELEGSLYTNEGQQYTNSWQNDDYDDDEELDEDDVLDDEDDDYEEELDEMLDDDDDDYEAEDVASQPVKRSRKPTSSNQTYHNKRDSSGRFAPKR